MTAVRSYKRPMSAASARRELVACSGTHFDPHIVRAFLDVSLGRLWWILGPVSWLALVPLAGPAPRAAAATNVARHSGRVVGGLRTAGIALVTAGAVTSLALGHPSPDQTAAPRQIESPTTAAAPAPTAPAGTPAAPVAPPRPARTLSNTTGAGAGAATGTPPAGTDLVAAPAPAVTTPPTDPAGPAPALRVPAGDRSGGHAAVAVGHGRARRGRHALGPSAGLGHTADGRGPPRPLRADDPAGPSAGQAVSASSSARSSSARVSSTRS